MKKFDVHLYTVVRVKVPNVEAASMKEAIDKAEGLVDLDRFFSGLRSANVKDMVSAEYADEIVHYLVDVQGDVDYRESQVFTASKRPMRTKR
jgi:hypothetical protein